MNHVVMTGNLTRDPDKRMTSGGVSVCTFSIAVQRRVANADGERIADFFNIVAWRGLADICGKYLAKGNKVGITGVLQTRSYEDKDVNTRYVTEIIADGVEFLSRKSDADDDRPF